MEYGRNFVVSLLSIIFLIDLLFLGGGRVIDFGGVTLRMVIFSIALLLSIYILVFYGVSNRSGLYFLICAVFVLFVSVFVAVFNGELEGIVASILTYMFVFLALFISQNSKFLGRWLVKLVPLLSVAMSLLYITFMSMVFLGFFNITKIFDFLPYSELFLRGGDGFQYKGFLTIAIGILFFIFIKPKFWVVGFIICCIAIVMTLTRGFLVSLVFTYIIYLYLNGDLSRMKRIILFLFVLLMVSFFLIYNIEFMFREGSDSTRIKDLLYLKGFYLENSHAIFLGNGLNSYVGERPAIENSYLDVLYRFGFFGLAGLFLFFMLALSDYKFLVKVKSDVRQINFLFYSFLFVFIQSNFNPYVNNYIGGVLVMVIFFYLKKMRLEAESN